MLQYRDKVQAAAFAGSHFKQKCDEFKQRS